MRINEPRNVRVIRRKTMRILLAILVLNAVIGAGLAALKPIDKDFHPVDNKAVAVYKTTPQYFAARGLVATTPEYRIESIHHTPPERCIEDGKSAIRWVRMNARHLGIDTRRVIAGGGSSGASIAAFAAYHTAFEPDDE